MFYSLENISKTTTFEKPFCSIIIAVYNAEAYINRCVDSILSQTFRDFEAIIIDDGSTDNGPSILDSYVTRDKRIRVFHKENGGLSSALNIGLHESKGDYIICVDPDDWIDSNMLSDLYVIAKNEVPDIIICDYYKSYKDHEIYKSQQPRSLNAQQIIRDLFFQKQQGYVWNKLIKRDCYGEG